MDRNSCILNLKTYVVYKNKKNNLINDVIFFLGDKLLVSMFFKISIKASYQILNISK